MILPTHSAEASKINIILLFFILLIILQSIGIFISNEFIHSTIYFQSKEAHSRASSLLGIECFAIDIEFIAIEIDIAIGAISIF